MEFFRIRTIFSEGYKLSSNLLLIIETALEKLSLTYGEYIILNYIYDHPGTTQYNIAKISGFTKQRVNQLVKTLAEEELLTMEKVETTKLLKKEITLTDKGLGTLNNCFKEFNKIGINFLTPEEIDTLADTLDLLKKSNNILMKIDSKTL